MSHGCDAAAESVDLAADPGRRVGRRRRNAGARRSGGPRRQPGHQRGDIPAVARPLGAFRSRARRHAVRRAARLDPGLRHLLSPRHRRHRPAAHPAHHALHRAGGAGRLGGDHRSRGALHGRLPHPRGRDDRRVRGARRDPVLRVLGGHADPDVPHHRHLGRQAARVRGAEVLPLHLSRFRVHAGRPAVPLRQGGHLRSGPAAKRASRPPRAAVAVPGLPAGLRRQGADVAGAHLAAGRARRGADRRLGGRRILQTKNGRLRLSALQPADPARRLPRVRRADDALVAHRHRLHRLRGLGAAGHEEAHRLLLHLAHGLRHAGLLPDFSDAGARRLRQHGAAGPLRRAGADDLARLRLRRAVPVRRRALRPHAQPRDPRLRRRGQHHAGVRQPDDAVRHGQLRPARHLRLRRRAHAHPRRGLHPVDAEARGVRRDIQRSRRRAQRHRPARGLRARRAGDPGAGPGRLAGAADPRHAGEPRGAGGADQSGAGGAAVNAMFYMLSAASPEIVVLVTACLVLLVDSSLRDRGHAAAYWLAQAGLLLALIGCALLLPRVAGLRWFFGMVVIDPLAVVLKSFVLVLVIVALIYGREYLRPRRWLSGEYFALTLMVALGALVLISAGSLLMVYLGLELMSLSLYALVALHRDAPATSEAAMKYFVLGALASGMLLYGMSLVYGVTGTLDLQTLARTLTAAQTGQPVWVLALVLIIAGVAFKLGTVPFHMWVPDVYQGAATPVTLLVSTAPKIAAYAMAMRLLAMGLSAGAAQWSPILIVLAVASMALGNLVAIAQSDIKRMLAYSTIAHMGFLLLGVLAASPAGYAGAMFYSIVYALMSLGAFGVVILLAGAGQETDRLDEFTGLGRRSPWFALVALILFFSLAGVPPFAGFWAKWFVIKELIHSGHVVVAALAVFFSVIGAYYYLRIIRLMYFDVGEAARPLAADGDLSLALSVNGLAILAIGVMPGVLMSTCLRAIGH